MVAQSAGVVDYTDDFSTEKYAPSHTPNECPDYVTKQSDCKLPVILKFWEMRSTPSLP